jgi:hypothetical protein
MTPERPKTPEAWLERYSTRLNSGRGLTAREWDHYDELKRTVARGESGMTDKRPICPRCLTNPIDPVLLGPKDEGYICRQCWLEDRKDEPALESRTRELVGGIARLLDKHKVKPPLKAQFWIELRQLIHQDLTSSPLQ